jgi:hypothetical protein
MPLIPYAPCTGVTLSISRKSLGKLLLDEEGSQVRKLPCTSDTENDELDNGPADNARVCVFGLVAEFGFALLLSY